MIHKDHSTSRSTKISSIIVAQLLFIGELTIDVSLFTLRYLPEAEIRKTGKCYYYANQKRKKFNLNIQANEQKKKKKRNGRIILEQD